MGEDETMGEDMHDGMHDGMHDDMHGEMDHSSHEQEPLENVIPPMPMWFWATDEITFVIPGLDSNDGPTYFLGWILTFCAAIFIEGLLHLRNALFFKLKV